MYILAGSIYFRMDTGFLIFLQKFLPSACCMVDLVLMKKGEIYMSTASLNEQNISIMSSFSGSTKVYVEGSRPDIRVPMREITLSPTTGSFGEEEKS